MSDTQILVTTIVMAVLALVGAVALAIGIVQLVKARRYERRCTAQAPAAVVDVVDRTHGISRHGGSKRRGSDGEPEVVAANETIAAKKRAWQEKKRREAQQEADEALATWHLVVEWTPEGGSARTLESERGMRAQALRRVKKVDVRYDPGDPGLAYILQEGTPRKAGIALVLSGAALVVLCVVCWLTFPALAQMSAGL